MTNNIEKKSEEQPEEKFEIQTVEPREYRDIGDMVAHWDELTTATANLSDAARKALDFAKQFNAPIDDLPVPAEVKDELKAISNVETERDQILFIAHLRYDGLKTEREAITKEMDAIQAFLKRTTGKTSGRVRRSPKSLITRSSPTSVGRWLVSPAEVLDIEYEEGKSPSTGFIRGTDPFDGTVVESNYNALKQRVARHPEAVERGWVTWE